MSGAVYRRLYHLEIGKEYNIRFVLQTDGLSEIDSVEMVLLRSSLFDIGFPSPDTNIFVSHSHDTLEINFVAKESEMIFAVSASRATISPYHFYVDEYSMRQKWVTNITCPLGNFHYAHDNYRFGFNGAENLDEIKGFGNTPDLGDRWHDPRLGRMNWKIDRRTAEYPWQSPYAYYGNTPIWQIDFNGEGEEFDEQDDGSWKRRVNSSDNKDNTITYTYHYKNGDVSFYNVQTRQMTTVKAGTVQKQLEEHRAKQAKINNYVEKTGKVLGDVGDGIALVGYVAAPFTSGGSLSVAAVGEGISFTGTVLEHSAKFSREGPTNENLTNLAVDGIFEFAPLPFEFAIKKSNLDEPAKDILKLQVRKINLLINFSVDKTNEEE